MSLTESMSEGLTPQQTELYELMSEISEECYCAGWMNGNEFRLWRAVIDPTDDRWYGMAEIEVAQVERLRALSTGIGGWIVWFDDQDDPDLPPAQWGPRYVPMADWLKQYEANG